jgi:hypothetical protein
MFLSAQAMFPDASPVCLRVTLVMIHAMLLTYATEGTFSNAKKLPRFPLQFQQIK